MKRPTLDAKKVAGFVISGALLATQSLFAYQPEKSFWDQRRQVARRTSPSVLASLPLGHRAGDNLAAQFPSPQMVRSSLTPSVVRSLPKSFLKSHADLLTALSPVHGSVRKVSLGKNAGARGPVVIHIQDVHMNAEAQKNIRETVATLLNSGKVGLVALEGSTEDIALQPFVDFPNRKAVELTADYLLRENKISGPIHAALTASGKLPRILGIDDPVHYAANVQAYKDSAPKLDETRRLIKAHQLKIDEQKKSVFSPALLALDETVSGYRADSVSLGDYVGVLVEIVSRKENNYSRHSGMGLAGTHASSFRNVDKLMQAINTERSLDFKQVEAERSRLIEKLTNSLNTQEINELMAQSVAYRTGELRYGDFYAELRETCRKKMIRLSDYPAMDEYVRYVLLCDGIDAEKLLNEMASLEKAAYDTLAATSEEKDLAAHSRQVWLTSKLVDFCLTPPEWKEYEGGKGNLEVFSSPLTKDGALASFESFYREAEARDTAMAKNVLNALDLNSKSGPALPPIALLVTGGFHAEGMAKHLTEQGATVISYIPKIAKVDTAKGSAYLSVFTQEKTPLEKLFQGEKLFLSPNMERAANEIGAPAVAGVSSAVDPDLSIEKAQALRTFLDETMGAGVDVQVYKSGGDLEKGTVKISVKIGTKEMIVEIKTGVQFEIISVNGFKPKVPSWFIGHYMEIVARLHTWMGSATKWIAKLTEAPILWTLPWWTPAHKAWWLMNHPKIASVSDVVWQLAFLEETALKMNLISAVSQVRILRTLWFLLGPNEPYTTFKFVSQSKATGWIGVGVAWVRAQVAWTLGMELARETTKKDFVVKFVQDHAAESEDQINFVVSFALGLWVFALMGFPVPMFDALFSSNPLALLLWGAFIIPTLWPVLLLFSHAFGKEALDQSFDITPDSSKAAILLRFFAVPIVLAMGVGLGLGALSSPIWSGAAIVLVALPLQPWIRNQHDEINQSEQLKSMGKSVYSEDFKAKVEKIEAEGREVVRKKHAYKFLSRREIQALDKLILVPNIEKLERIENDRTIILSFINGNTIDELMPTSRNWAERGEFTETVLSRLEKTVDSMHTAGVSHGALNNLRNIIVDKSGNPHIIDFETAMILDESKKGLPGMVNRWLFEMAKKADLYAIMNLKLKYGQVRQEVEPNLFKLPSLWTVVLSMYSHVRYGFSSFLLLVRASRGEMAQSLMEPKGRTIADGWSILITFLYTMCIGAIVLFFIFWIDPLGYVIFPFIAYWGSALAAVRYSWINYANNINQTPPRDFDRFIQEARSLKNPFAPFRFANILMESADVLCDLMSEFIKPAYHEIRGANKKTFFPSTGLGELAIQLWKIWARFDFMKPIHLFQTMFFPIYMIGFFLELSWDMFLGNPKVAFAKIALLRQIFFSRETISPAKSMDIPFRFLAVARVHDHDLFQHLVRVSFALEIADEFDDILQDKKQGNIFLAGHLAAIRILEFYGCLDVENAQRSNGIDRSFFRGIVSGADIFTPGMDIFPFQTYARSLEKLRGSEYDEEWNKVRETLSVEDMELEKLGNKWRFSPTYLVYVLRVLVKGSVKLDHCEIPQFLFVHDRSPLKLESGEISVKPQFESEFEEYLNKYFTLVGNDGMNIGDKALLFYTFKYKGNIYIKNSYLSGQSNEMPRATGWIGVGAAWGWGFVVGTWKRMRGRLEHGKSIRSFARDYVSHAGGRRAARAEDILNAMVSFVVGLVAGQQWDVLAWLGLATLSPPWGIIILVALIIVVWFLTFVGSHYFFSKALERLLDEKPSVGKAFRLFLYYLVPLLMTPLASYLFAPFDLTSQLASLLSIITSGIIPLGMFKLIKLVHKRMNDAHIPDARFIESLIKRIDSSNSTFILVLTSHDPFLKDPGPLWNVLRSVTQNRDVQISAFSTSADAHSSLRDEFSEFDRVATEQGKSPLNAQCMDDINEIKNKNFSIVYVDPNLPMDTSDKMGSSFNLAAEALDSRGYIVVTVYAPDYSKDMQELKDNLENAAKQAKFTDIEFETYRGGFPGRSEEILYLRLFAKKGDNGSLGQATSQWGLKFAERLGSKVDPKDGRERFGALIEWSFSANVTFWGLVGTFVFAGAGFGWLIAPVAGLVYGILFVASHFLVPESLAPATKVKVGVVQALLMGVIYGVLISVTPYLLGAVPLLGIPEFGVQAGGAVWALAGLLHHSFDKENLREEGQEAAWKLIKQLSHVQGAFEAVMPGIHNGHTEEIVGNGNSLPEWLTKALSRLKTDKEFRMGFLGVVQTAIAQENVSGSSLNLLSALVMAATAQPIAHVHILGNSPDQELQTLQGLIERERKTSSGFSVALVVSERQRIEFKTMIDVFEARGVAVFSVDLHDQGWTQEALVRLDGEMSSFLAKANGVVATVGGKVGIRLNDVTALRPDSKLRTALMNALTLGEVVETFLRFLRHLASNA